MKHLLSILLCLALAVGAFGQAGDPLPHFGSGGPYVTAIAPVNGTSAVQTLTFGGTPTGGTFTLSFQGRTTSAISWSATNSTLVSNIQTALRALPTIGSSPAGVTVAVLSMTAGIGTINVTFAGNLQNLAVTTMTSASSLTGTSPTLAVTVATAGVTADGRTAAAGSLIVSKASGQLYLNLSTTSLAPNWQPLCRATPPVTALTDGATITWTVDPTQNEQEATVTLAGNRTLAFSGLVSGMHGTLFVTQDATGSRTLTLPTNLNPGTVTLSTTASYVDKLTWHYLGSALYFDNVVTHYH